MNLVQSTLWRALEHDPAAPEPADEDDQENPYYWLDEVEEFWRNRTRLPGRQARGVADDTDWSPLYGRLVTYTGRRRRPCSGVVLPPTPRTPEGRMRVALTQLPRRAPRPVEVRLITPSECTIDPSPATVDELLVASGRPPRGAEGLPLYHGEIPGHALATVTQLRERHGRRRAAGQRPIAQLCRYWFMYDLYAVADAEEL